MKILISILFFNFLIFSHELGHFIAARKSGVKVNEFSIGMGPKAISKTKDETSYSIRLFPVGGFVAMEGEDSDADTEGSLSKASFRDKFLIFAAGGLANILLGIILLITINISSNPIETIFAAFNQSIDMVRSVIDSLTGLIIGKYALSDMAGVIGIINMGNAAMSNGYKSFIYLMSFISINLGVFNLLPLPVLDGGKLLFLIIEKIRSKPLSEKSELIINGLGILLLTIIMVSVTVADVRRLII